MLLETVVTAFIITFVVIAVLGHVLLQAVSRPAKPGRRQEPTNARHITRQSPVRGSRRRVGSSSRAAGSTFEAALTRSSSALMRRTSLTIQRMATALPIAPSAILINGAAMMGGIDDLLGSERPYSP